MPQAPAPRKPYLLALCAASLFAACADEEPTKATSKPSGECDGNTLDCAEESGDGDTPIKPTTPGKSGSPNPPSKVPDSGIKDAGADSKTQATDLACEGQRIVTEYCSDCHGQKPIGAPMSLTTAEHYQATAKSGIKMHAAVKQRIHETNAKLKMPPDGYDEPTAAELAKLTEWMEQGAPASTRTCAAAPTQSADAGSISGGPLAPPDPNYVPPTDAELECFKIVAHSGDLKSKFHVGAASDAYFNLTFAAPWKSMAYGIAFKPIIDNSDVIHHWLLFQDDLPGIPGSVTSSIGAHPAGQLLTGWAPGGDTIDFRDSKEDVALELPGDGTTYTMEYHYNSTDLGATDASGVEVCVQRKKPRFTAGLSWLGFDQLLIPSDKWTGVCTPISQEPIRILAVTPHMHVQGRHMKGTINRKDGTKEILHDEKFNFDFQKTYVKNATLMPGDTITTECTFAQPMSFGTQTSAEMCYLFTMAYPKGALRGPDLWGTFAHGGSSCLGQ